MELPTPTTTPKHNISKFALLWVALVTVCLCALMVTLGLTGWGFYTVIKQADEKSQIPYARATAAAQWPVAFADAFEHVSDHWYTGDYSDKDYHEFRSISKGVYSWTLDNASGYTFWQPADAGTFKDFELSVDARHTAGTTFDDYGLVFCVAGRSYYEFSIQDSGQYNVAVWVSDQRNPLIKSTYSSEIKPGEFNHLTVLAEAGVFKLFINSVFVDEFKDTTLTSGDVGVTLGPQDEPDRPNTQPQTISSTFYNSSSTAEYDNFEVLAPDDLSTEHDSAQLPAIKPEKGTLVFASTQDGNRNIYTIASNGSGLKQLTNDPASDYAPRWSPDGKKIVFCSLRDGNSEIYVMDADGKNVTRLTNNPGKDITPDWSADGKQIIFASDRAGNYDLYLMSAQGESVAVNQLTHTLINESNPTISPDGTQILFQAKTEILYDIYRMSSDGKHTEMLFYSDNRSYVDGNWSPDGKKIAYEYDGALNHSDIFVGTLNMTVSDLPADRSYPAVQITHNNANNLFPNWSPDGKQIVYVSKTNGQTDIFIMPADGNGIFRVTHNGGNEESPDWTGS
jgi:TolB protein